MKSIKFFTLGCKVNQYDTQAMREQFLNCGFRELDDHQPADIYLINTCTVTHRADSESFNLIRRAKRENPKARIMVTGCLVALDSQRVLSEGGVSLINQGTGSRGISYFKGHTRAFLKIQDGCNNFCAYCKVPLVRGNSRSKPLDNIISEAEKLVKNGFKEIVLSGICLGAYGRDLKPVLNLVDVIEALENLKGLLRLRLSSIEAGDVSEGLLEKLSQSKKMCRHLHIPIQSGDDEILKKMQRRYTARDYLDLIHKIKSSLPDIAITTDVLLGFPGEGKENFNNTLKLIKEILPLKVHIFPYSKRERTAAYNFMDTIPGYEIKTRITKLQKIALSCALKYKQRFIHKEKEVLIEGRSKEYSNFWEGLTDNYLRVLVRENKDLKNQVITVKLKKIKGDFILAGKK